MKTNTTTQTHLNNIVTAANRVRRLYDARLAVSFVSAHKLLAHMANEAILDGVSMDAINRLLRDLPPVNALVIDPGAFVIICDTPDHQPSWACNERILRCETRAEVAAVLADHGYETHVGGRHVAAHAFGKRVFMVTNSKLPDFN